MKISIKGVIVPNEEKWVYDFLEMDAVCPKDVLSAIESNTDGVLDVYINSPGGEISSGSEIYAAIQEFPGTVNIHVVGYACSAASVIACAGHSDMVRTGMFMYHNVNGAARGDYHALAKESHVLQIANRAIAAAYTAKTGMTEAELLKRMDAETWLTAEDAVQLGFIDEIAESKNVKLQNTAFGLLPQEAIDRIRNTVKCPQDAGSAAPEIRNQAQDRLNLLKLKARNFT